LQGDLFRFVLEKAIGKLASRIEDEPKPKIFIGFGET
jgi:hypothetical protein